MGAHGLSDNIRNRDRGQHPSKHAFGRRAEPRRACAPQPTRRLAVSPFGEHAMTRRNKVAHTILIGLALIGIFAVTQSGIAVLAITRFGASFNQIAQTNLPALIAASQLSELSQTLVATAPEIALADTQVRRQAIADQLDGRVTRLARSVADLDRGAVNHEQASTVQRELDAVVANLQGLDELVRQRIDANTTLDAVMARLPSLAA